MTFLVVRNTITVGYQFVFSTTFSNSPLKRANGGAPNAATELVERIFMRVTLSYIGFDGKTCLETQNC